MKNNYLFPFYRLRTSKYDFDDYASKGSTVYPVRKYHRNMAAITDGGMLPMLPAAPVPSQGERKGNFFISCLYRQLMTFLCLKLLPQFYSHLNEMCYTWLL